ncbi:MAG: RtcB family protein [Methanohalobium sp.]|uniref:RtcB family protein n=1 Tax=Methanohalobium sp. TaxID=2837493 RepID=UPI00397CFA3F
MKGDDIKDSEVYQILKKVDDNIWDIPIGYKSIMKVPGRVFISSELLEDLEKETLDQVANVASLPGIQNYSMAMPDAHLGYGFPIGGVAAFDKDEGVISPGGVGFDINCGVRLLSTSLQMDDVRPQMKRLVNDLFNKIPSGLGSKAKLRVSDAELDDVFVKGSQWAIENGYGVKADVDHCEGKGLIEGADPSQVSKEARKRGKPQLGTLGSGNHFLEVQCVDKIYDENIASDFGLEEGQITVSIHCGSRGAGHQICSDHLRELTQAVKRYGIDLPDKQLACAPANSREAQNYFKAMACAANYAWTNRQVITHWTREVFENIFGNDLDINLVYDVAHNVAKLEEHTINGERKQVYVHRKGATRAFPPYHPELPKDYQKSGQPVLIPGSMGTPSFVLHGTKDSMDISFGSACHGSGRLMSRKHAKKELSSEGIQKRLESMGITVKVANPKMISEEAPEAYKSSSEVVDVVHDVGIARKVARLSPVGVIKG